MWNHEYVGKNYIAETGFVPRLYHYDQENDTTYRHSFWRLEPSAGYYYYPENSKLYRHGASLYLDYYADSSKRMTDKNLTFTYLIEFLNKSEVEFKAHDQSTDYAIRLISQEKAGNHCQSIPIIINLFQLIILQTQDDHLHLALILSWANFSTVILVATASPSAIDINLGEYFQ